MWKTSCEKWSARAIEVLVATAWVGCATVPSPEPVLLPVALQQSFGTCHARDGAARVSVKTDDGMLQADAEWIAPAPGKWDLELTNPIGQPLLSMNYGGEHGEFSFAGRLGDGLPSVSVDKNGYLTVNGYFVGVRPEELSCFFGYVFPAIWLDHAYGFRHENDELSFISHDRHRDIEVTARHISQPDKREVCTRIAWSTYLGVVRREGTLCFRGTSAKVATLRGFGNWDIRWRTASEADNES